MYTSYMSLWFKIHMVKYTYYVSMGLRPFFVKVSFVTNSLGVNQNPAE